MAFCPGGPLLTAIRPSPLLPRPPSAEGPEALTSGQGAGGEWVGEQPGWDAGWGWRWHSPAAALGGALLVFVWARLRGITAARANLSTQAGD